MNHQTGIAGWLKKSTGALVLVGLACPAFGAEPAEDGRTSRISDESVPTINAEGFVQRPKPLLELGNAFLGTGNIEPGTVMPGGAVWQPSLLVFGTYRTAVQAFNAGGETQAEWVNRLDLLANLQLTGTERVLVGIRPLDEDESFTSYQINDDDGWNDGTNIELDTLFFEGDLGELFANADADDFGSNDLGFSVGRQSLLYQGGMLINDNIDSVGITRNTLLPKGGSDFQATFIYGWNEIHRDNNIEEDDADVNMYGLFFAADYPTSTINVDFVYINDPDLETDGFYYGASTIQRIGHYNTTFRVLGSSALDEESDAISDGTLLFAEVSWTPAWTDNIVYVNGFWGIDQFSSVARDPSVGGPLGRVGVLFAAVGMGRYGAPLSNRADDSVGAAVGYQMFLGDGFHEQLIFEAGVKQSTVNQGDSLAAIGARYQKALDQHWVLQLDTFGSLQESRDPGYGGRVELRYQF